MHVAGLRLGVSTTSATGVADLTPNEYAKRSKENQNLNRANP
jgi:hypothetical protein